ncbi:hypothetical protein [Clostridium botulinum]
MKPSFFQTTIENQFDYICKRAMYNERKDYIKILSIQSKREILFSDMGDYLVNQFLVVDSYSTDYQIFTRKNARGKHRTVELCSNDKKEVQSLPFHSSSDICRVCYGDR